MDFKDETPATHQPTVPKLVHLNDLRTHKERTGDEQREMCTGDEQRNCRFTHALPPGRLSSGARDLSRRRKTKGIENVRRSTQLVSFFFLLLHCSPHGGLHTVSSDVNSSHAINFRAL